MPPHDRQRANAQFLRERAYEAARRVSPGDAATLAEIGFKDQELLERALAATFERHATRVRHAARLQAEQGERHVYGSAIGDAGTVHAAAKGRE